MSVQGKIRTSILQERRAEGEEMNGRNKYKGRPANDSPAWRCWRGEAVSEMRYFLLNRDQVFDKRCVANEEVQGRLKQKRGFWNGERGRSKAKDEIKGRTRKAC